MEGDGLRFGPIGPRSIHLCVDMQRLFAPDGPWATPWMPKVLPILERLVAHDPTRTVFTRFIPPLDAEDMPGAWQRYYKRWEKVTRRHLDPAMLDLVPALGEFAPPAAVIDKTRYSAFSFSPLQAYLETRGIDTLIISGAETDVCVSATVFGAVERGYRAIVVSDAICSSSDAGHDALMTIYRSRLGSQIETAPSDEIVENWRPA